MKNHWKVLLLFIIVYDRKRNGDDFLECIRIEQGTSWVRLFHAAPNAPAVDVYANNMLVTQGLQFTKMTDYMALPTGQYNVQIFATGDRSTPVISAMLDIPDGEVLTAAATGAMNDLKLIVLKDNNDTGVSDEGSIIRAVHLSPNAPGVNITANGVPLANDLKFREMTDYVMVPDGTYNVEVTAHSNNMSVLTFPLQLMDETIGTAYVLGDLPDLIPMYVIDGGTYVCR